MEFTKEDYPLGNNILENIIYWKFLAGSKILKLIT